MKAAKSKKKLKEMLYPPQEKAFQRKGNSITPAKKMPQFHKLFENTKN